MTVLHIRALCGACGPDVVSHKLQNPGHRTPKYFLEPPVPLRVRMRVGALGVLERGLGGAEHVTPSSGCWCRRARRGWHARVEHGWGCTRGTLVVDLRVGEDGRGNLARGARLDAERLALPPYQSSMRVVVLHGVVLIHWKVVPPPSYAVRRVSVSWREPTTPTSSAKPRGVRVMRQMRMKWRSACE